jgi:phosphatidylglycerophosphatase A
LIKLLFSTLIALFLALGILLYLDASTLFLAALLLAVIAVKTRNKGDFLDKLTGLWFALSVSPAVGVQIDELANFTNGFLIQSLLSFAFFLYFYTSKPSVIQRLYDNAKTGAGVIISSTIAGFAAGILSAVLWQAYLQISF